MIKKIMIVDDSSAARFFIRSCLPKDRGYELFESTNGKDGVELFKRVAPDLTFLDLTMPVMDGFEALNEIKQSDKDALVVILTADIQKKTYEKVESLGALMLVKKPPTKENILDVLTKAEQSLENIKKN